MSSTKKPKRGPISLRMAKVASGFAPIWVNTDRHPIGQLTAIGSTMVGIVIDDHELFLVGIDPATGNELWHQQITPSTVTPGVIIEVTPLGDDKVAYFRPVRNPADWAELVIANARTGKDLVTSPRGLFASLPHVCMNGKDICVLYQRAAGAVRQYRLEVATGDYLAESDDLAPRARLLEAPSLIDLGDRPGNTLAWLHDGKLEWRTPISAAFPSGFSSDNGWMWRLFDGEHVIVGSVYGRLLAAGREHAYDLARNSAMAGLSERTGEVLWRDNGSRFDCHLGYNDHPVRCRVRGVTTSQPSGATSVEGLAVTIEGFVPVTGETTWSVPIGPAGTVIDDNASLAIAGPTQVVLSSFAGPIVLDYATGNVHAPSPGATFWCMTVTTYQISLSYLSGDGTRRYDRSGGQLAAICDDRGHSSTVTPSAEATAAAGAHAGAYAVIAGEHGYVGFRIR
jgi:hypothetical protein